jgi:hypothetical protein
MRIHTLALLLLVVMSALQAGCSQPVNASAFRTVRLYDLLVALPRASYQIHDASYFKTCDCAVADQKRAGFYLHPAGRITFPPVHLGARPALSFWIAVDESTWNQSSDGVEFVVSVTRANTAGAVVFRRHVDPANHREDRRWIEGRFSLKAFANQDVQVSLATEAGASQNFNFDWAIWAEPKIVLDDQ